MSGRTIWKGTLRFGDERVPVKLRAAVEDRHVRFRLLHRADGEPVRQRFVDRAGRVVPPGDVRRAYITPDRDMVVMSPRDLERLRPPPSRDIEVLAYVPAAALEPRWYGRPYYLAPDGRPDDYAALAGALEQSGRVGVARWVMRNREYRGVLCLAGPALALITLRAAQEMMALDRLHPPWGPYPTEQEVRMARQLVGHLERRFEPAAYRDEHRRRLERLIEARARGVAVALPRARRPRRSSSLTDALRASLDRERKHA